MKAQTKIFWLLYLVFFTAGCSSNRVACYSRPEGPGEHDFNDQDTCRIERGDDLIITLIDGKQVEGTVESISADEIILSDEYDFSESQYFHLDQIQTIETYGASSSSDGTIAIVIGSVLVVGGVVLFAATASLRDGVISN